MAIRKQFLLDSKPDDELVDLLAKARNSVVTEAEFQEQRISFVFGNAMNRERVTKESVRHSVQHTRLRP